jgi:hypothetical protein
MKKKAAWPAFFWAANFLVAIAAPNFLPSLIYCNLYVVYFITLCLSVHIFLVCKDFFFLGC